MPSNSERRLFEALATVSRAFTEGGVTAEGEPAAVAAMDPESRAALGEASLAVAYGAFASEGGEAGAMHMLVGAIGLMALRAGEEEPDPPAEIMAVLAHDERVEAEIDRAGEAVDAEFPRDAAPEAVAAALEARIVGTAVTLAGCTLPEAAAPGGQAAVRLLAARYLARLAAGLLTMNAAGPLPDGAGQAGAEAAGPAGVGGAGRAGAGGA